MKRICGIVAVILLMTGCGTGSREADMKAFLNNYEAAVQPISTRIALASWNASVTGDEAQYAAAAEASLELTRYHANPAVYQQLKEWLADANLQDKALRRQLELVFHSYEARQGDPDLLKRIIEAESAVEQQFNTFRATVDGKPIPDNELKTILVTETKDMEHRQKVWDATKQIGATVAEQVLELARMRNELARSLGYDNYFQMSLRLSEIEPDQLIALFDQLDDTIADEFGRVKDEIDTIQAAKYGLKKDGLMPWHYEDPFFQSGISMEGVDLDRFYSEQDIVDLATRFYAGIGLDVTDILERSSLYEQEGKMQHAFCTHIDRAGDVRILCNIRPNADWMDTTLHELGHAVYDKYLGADLPYMFRDPAHSFTTEAIANLFGRQAKDPEFLITYCGVAESEAREAGQALRRSTRFQQLVFSRWCQVMVRFEKALYENPDAGVEHFNNLWWELKGQYQLLQKPDGRNNPDWASKIHVAIYPVYYHNYMMGELLASQLYATMMDTVITTADGSHDTLCGQPGVGEFLTEKVFKPGASLPWNDMIEQATGSKLSAEYYSAQFVSN